MNFQRGRHREELEINLIPLIDVFLVILIFLMITTTYSKFSGLEINLPTADSPQNKEQPNEINVVVTAAGEVLVNKSPLGTRDIAAIAAAMKRVAGTEQGTGRDHQRRCQGRTPKRYRCHAGRAAGRPFAYFLCHPAGAALRTACRCLAAARSDSLAALPVFLGISRCWCRSPLPIDWACLAPRDCRFRWLLSAT
jgi:biopolymer transport protein ExbD